MDDLTRRKVVALRQQLAQIAQVEGGEQFMNWPDRWWEFHTWRCINDHVSTRVLKSEELGRDACLAGGCQAPLCLTFPEDVDGPLNVSNPQGNDGGSNG